MMFVYLYWNIYLIFIDTPQIPKIKPALNGQATNLVFNTNKAVLILCLFRNFHILPLQHNDQIKITRDVLANGTHLFISYAHNTSNHHNHRKVNI